MHIAAPIADPVKTDMADIELAKGMIKKYGDGGVDCVVHAIPVAQLASRSPRFMTGLLGLLGDTSRIDALKACKSVAHDPSTDSGVRDVAAGAATSILGNMRRIAEPAHLLTEIVARKPASELVACSHS